MEEHGQEETNGQTEPELLYHYTTQEGLLGIVEKKKIWASHLQYLNDASEGQIFTRLLIEEFNQRATTKFEDPLSQIRGLAQLMRSSDDHPESPIQLDNKEVVVFGSAAFSWISSQDAFVASFSEQGDLLSQWRAYSGETGGFSISFPRPYLKSVGVHFLENRKDSFFDDQDPLVPCRYCDKPEEESLKREIEQIVDSYAADAGQANLHVIPEMKERFNKRGAVAKKHFFPLGKRRALTKDQSFREEAEWRLVFQLERAGTSNSEPEFRPGRSMLIPYFQIELTWENQALEIPEIIVGPCPHPLEAKRSVERLMRKEGVRKFEVRNSKIPYRNW